MECNARMVWNEMEWNEMEWNEWNDLVLDTK